MSDHCKPQDDQNCFRDDLNSDPDEYDQAVADFEAIIQRSEQFCEDFRELAITSADQGDHDRAIAVYNMMIRLIPDEPMRYRARGGSYAVIGNYQQAIADLNEAIRLDPDYSDAYIDLSIINGTLGQ